MEKDSKSYTIKEFIAHVIGDVNQKIDVILDDVKETKNNVGIQNGRVRKLEDWSIDAQKLIESSIVSINNFNIERAKIAGGYKVITVIAVVVPIICTTIFGLYIRNRNNEIDTKIKSSLETSYKASEEKITEIVEKVLSEKIIQSEYAR